MSISLSVIHHRCQLQKLTVPMLKEFCKIVGIKAKTAKGDIIEQVEAHFSK